MQVGGDSQDRFIVETAVALHEKWSAATPLEPESGGVVKDQPSPEHRRPKGVDDNTDGSSRGEDLAGLLRGGGSAAASA